MHSLVKLVTAVSLASASVMAGQAEAASLPKVFTDAGATMQSRVCGELLTGLALSGVQSMKMQYPTGKVPLAQRKIVYNTGAQAVVLLSMAGSLKIEERLKAGEIAAAIEKLDPGIYVDTAHFCQRRIEAWINAGEVKKAQLTQAYSQSKQLLDRAFSAGEGDDRDQ